jgi:hypothetical protein
MGFVGGVESQFGFRKPEVNLEKKSKSCAHKKPKKKLSTYPKTLVL